MHYLNSLALLLAVSLPLFGNAAEQAADITTLLAKNPTFADVKISPDGRFLAVAVFEEDKRQLLCLDRATMKAVGGARMVDKDEVGDFFWANSERIVMKINSRERWEKQPKFYGELFGINCDGSQRKLLFGYRKNDKSSSLVSSNRQAWADIIHRLPSEPNHILISSTNWTESGGAKADIFKMDVYSGKLSRTGKAPMGYSEIMADNKGLPRVAAGVDEKNLRHVFLASATGEWVENDVLNAVDQFSAIRMLPDQSGFYFSGRLDTNFTGLYQYNFADNSIKTLYSSDKIDITYPMFSTDGESIYAVRIDESYPAYLLLNKESPDTKVFRALTEKFAGADVKLTSQTMDGTLRIVRVEADALAPIYFIHDNKTGKTTRLLDSHPQLHGVKLVQIQAFEFDSFDKTVVRGYATLGAGNSSELPTVVLLHGGPYGVRDYWGYNSEVQMLALAGYNVLQINFRASDGYGSAFADAADLHWGDHVQQDIIAGTRWAISQGVAKAGNICIMGGSFGAYSALQSAALAPDLFSCAIGVAGVYDLTLLTKKGDMTRTIYGEAYLDGAIGKDEAQLKSFSPVYQVDKIKANVLLIHGEKDERAPLVHAELLQEALENAGKQVKLSEYDDEAHGFYAEENQIRYFKEVQQYLSTQLKR
jgi:dipeptidyl aminopeptidase/acylaminoacyl peptidase